VKFDIPNRFDVYLHDTPERTAFNRPERALSHGCIRLQQPDKLLTYLFPAADLRPKMPGRGDTGPRETRSVPVPDPLPVFLLYWTAYGGADGRVHFRDDIYGHDTRITEALSRSDRSVDQAFLVSGCGWKPHAT
jgi:murein L,D-transpeptidase YcbB/YkuD